MANLHPKFDKMFEQMKDLDAEELCNSLIGALDTDKAEELILWIWNTWDMALEDEYKVEYYHKDLNSEETYGFYEYEETAIEIAERLVREGHSDVRVSRMHDEGDYEVIWSSE